METYVSFVLEHKHLIPPNHYLEMRYEDLLSEPLEQLRRLLDFADHPVEDNRLLAVSKRIDKSRLDNSAYAASYRDKIPALVSRPLVRQLGYSYGIADQ